VGFGVRRSGDRAAEPPYAAQDVLTVGQRLTTAWRDHGSGGAAFASSSRWWAFGQQRLAALVDHAVLAFFMVNAERSPPGGGAPALRFGGVDHAVLAFFMVNAPTLATLTPERSPPGGGAPALRFGVVHHAVLAFSC
jgi:hypothetical protein